MMLFAKTLGIDVSVNEKPVRAIIDSGAKVSLVTDEWYREHLLLQQVVVHGLNLQITHAN